MMFDIEIVDASRHLGYSWLTKRWILVEKEGGKGSRGADTLVLNSVLKWSLYSCTMFDLNVEQLHQIYQEFSHNRKTAFLQLILSDIFKNTWHETQHNTADMLLGQFDIGFANIFRDPLSTAVMKLLETREDQKNRRMIARFGFYHLSKAWRLKNTFKESTNHDTINAIKAKTTQINSLLCSNTKLQYTITDLKNQPLIKPDTRYLTINSIDNYRGTCE